MEILAGTLLLLAIVACLLSILADCGIYLPHVSKKLGMFKTELENLQQEKKNLGWKLGDTKSKYARLVLQIRNDHERTAERYTEAKQDLTDLNKKIKQARHKLSTMPKKWIQVKTHEAINHETAHLIDITRIKCVTVKKDPKTEQFKYYLVCRQPKDDGEYLVEINEDSYKYVTGLLLNLKETLS